jgi:glycosyltransferase involved in cell wall biosynthesis
METMKSILAIPAWNEEKNIAAVVEQAKILRLVGAIENFVVIDDGSTDRTSELAAKSGAKVISLPKNMGKGGAFIQGALYCKRNGADIMVAADADIIAGLTADKIRFMLEELSVPSKGGETEMVVYPTTALEGTHGFSTRAEGNSGFRAIRMEALNFLFSRRVSDNSLELSGSSLAREFRDQSQGFALELKLGAMLFDRMRLLADIKGAVLTLPTHRNSPAFREKQMQEIAAAAKKMGIAR